MSKKFRINDLVLDDSKDAVDFYYKDEIAVTFTRYTRCVDKFIPVAQIWRLSKPIVFYTKVDEPCFIHNITKKAYTIPYLRKLNEIPGHQDEFDEIRMNSYRSYVKKDYFGRIGHISKTISSNPVWEVLNSSKSNSEYRIETKQFVTINGNTLDFGEAVFSDNFQDLEDYKLLE